MIVIRNVYFKGEPGLDGYPGAMGRNGTDGTDGRDGRRGESVFLSESLRRNLSGFNGRKGAK